MDKNAMKKKEQKNNLVYLLMLILLFILFVLSGLLNEILGMLMFGVLVFYVILGNNNYNVEHRAYEEILQSKRELLNYDKKNEMSKNEENNAPYIKKWHLIVVVLFFVLVYLCSYVSIELGMLVLGGLFLYILWI